jgi:hypothetical protein
MCSLQVTFPKLKDHGYFDSDALEQRKIYELVVTVRMYNLNFARIVCLETEALASHLVIAIYTLHRSDHR